MFKFLFFIGMILCVPSFGYFLLGLMRLKPLWAAAPLFFATILFTLYCLNRQRRRGGKSPDGHEPINGKS